MEKNLGTWAKMPSENEQFYSVVQCGLDKWNAAFFCGSAAVLRRRALEEVGGFSGITITEDCETALELHARGWTSRYVDRPLIAGLQPETFASFIGQRSRWCRGMMQILILKNPLFRRGLHLPQRIGYLSSSLFWLFPFPRLVFVMAPLMFIFFDLKIYVANVPDFLSYTVTSMAVSVMLQNYLFGRVRWPWVSELYEYVQSFFLAPAILSVIRNPRKPTFNVTAKGLTLDKDHFSEFALPFVITFAVLLAASIVAGMRIWSGTSQSDLMVVVAIWNTFNLVIAATAIGVVAEKRERRRSHRLDLCIAGKLEVGSRIVDVVIEDASQGGVRMRPMNGEALHIERAMRVGALSVDFGPKAPELPSLPVAIRRMSSNAQGMEIGAEFFGLRAAHYAVIARLLYGSADPIAAFRAHRREGKSILFGTGEFITWSFREMLRSARLFARDVKDHKAKPEISNQQPGGDAGPQTPGQRFETPERPRAI